MQSSKNTKFIIDETQTNQRIDVVLAELLSTFSRSQLQKHIKDGKILVNSKPVKASFKLNNEDVIEILELENPALLEIKSQNIPLKIEYEDEDLLVVNKPFGMLTHPTTIERENTLVNALLHYTNGNLSDLNGDFRAGIVHRLDRDTSGLLLIAKHNQAHEFLQQQIKEKTAIRKYVAVLSGVLQNDVGHIETNYGRHPTKPYKMSVVEDGKVAITDYKVLERFNKNTFVEFTLQTGRTHQIRVHSKYINHPIVNDTLYGGEKLKVKTTEQVLQAYDLTFKNLKKEIVHINIDYDEDVKKVLTYLRNQK